MINNKVKEFELIRSDCRGPRRTWHEVLSAFVLAELLHKPGKLALVLVRPS